MSNLILFSYQVFLEEAIENLKLLGYEVNPNSQSTYNLFSNCEKRITKYRIQKEGEPMIIIEIEEPKTPWINPIEPHKTNSSVLDYSYIANVTELVIF